MSKPFHHTHTKQNLPSSGKPESHNVDIIITAFELICTMVKNKSYTRRTAGMDFFIYDRVHAGLSESFCKPVPEESPALADAGRSFLRMKGLRPTGS
jgi:hypothetical protein